MTGVYKMINKLNERISVSHIQRQCIEKLVVNEKAEARICDATNRFSQYFPTVNFLR